MGVCVCGLFLVVSVWCPSQKKRAQNMTLPPYFLASLAWFLLFVNNAAFFLANWNHVHPVWKNNFEVRVMFVFSSCYPVCAVWFFSLLVTLHLLHFQWLRCTGVGAGVCESASLYLTVNCCCPVARGTWLRLFFLPVILYDQYVSFPCLYLCIRSIETGWGVGVCEQASASRLVCTLAVHCCCLMARVCGFVCFFLSCYLV